jgi:hypothetical protein
MELGCANPARDRGLTVTVKSRLRVLGRTLTNAGKVAAILVHERYAIALFQLRREVLSVGGDVPLRQHERT